MNQQLEGKVAVVTGAGRGLGAAYARALAAAGAAVVLNDTGWDIGGDGPDASVVEAVTEQIRAEGGTALADATDIGSFGAAGALVQRALDQLGRIDIVVNNAGLIGSRAVAGVSAAEFERVMAGHVTGSVGTIRAALPRLIAQHWGRIINVTSEAALSREHAPGIAYSTAKAAIWGLTMAAATEADGRGVTVNAISPGALTRMSEEALAVTGIPVGLDLSPDRVAEVLLALCRDDAADINGRVIHTAGGHIREYVLTRAHDSDVVRRLTAIRDA